MWHRPSEILLAVVVASLWVGTGCDKDAGQTQETQTVENVPGFDPRAIVILGYLDHGQGNRGAVRWPRVAFAIGDGTLLLTAAHCVGDVQSSLRRPLSSNVMAISPYYGDIFDFEIIAVDHEADVAILKASWSVHPALPLGNQEELETATKILVAGRPLEESGAASFDGRLRAESLSVLTTSEAPSSQAVQLQGTRLVGPGWSGSALVVPETGRVVGVLGQLRIQAVSRVLFRSERRDALGCGIRSISALLHKHGLEVAATSRPGELKEVPDAAHAFSTIMDYFGTLFRKDLAQAVERARELTRLRSGSAHVHMLLAFSAQARASELSGAGQSFLLLAESSYEKAVQVDPNNAHARAAYSDLLRRSGRPEQALVQAEAALKIDPNDWLALVNYLMLLGGRRAAEAKDAAERLVARDSNDPYVWFYYSSALLHLGQVEESLRAAQKAVVLEPGGAFNGALADALHGLGRWDEARQHYEHMAQRCGCRSCWYKYARFLLDHFPDRSDEIRAAIEKTETSSGKEWSVSADEIRKLREELDARRRIP